MDPRKFDYLETIREKIEAGDTDDLADFIESIRHFVKTDPNFTELLSVIADKKYEDALSLVDEVIFEDMQSEFEEFYQEGELTSPLERGVSGDPDFDEGIEDDASEEGITFEEFDEENYYTGNNSEDDY